MISGLIPIGRGTPLSRRTVPEHGHFERLRLYTNVAFMLAERCVSSREKSLRYGVMIIGLIGVLVFLAGVVMPWVGMGMAFADPRWISTAEARVPSTASLLIRSLFLSASATAGALLLGLMPAAVLASCRGGTATTIFGLILAPLLVPPQVYAYAWQMATGPTGLLIAADGGGGWRGELDRALRAGMVSAAWLWPVVSLIVAAAWKSAGRAVYNLALLDASPVQAFTRAVIPGLRPQLFAAGSVVFCITLLEYAIPHLILVRVYATEFQVLIDAAAPAGQVVRMAAHVGVLIALVALFNRWALWSAAGWQEMDSNDAAETAGGGQWRLWPAWLVFAAVWSVSCVLPMVTLLRELHPSARWEMGFKLFAREWGWSVLVSLLAAAMAAALAVAIMLFGIISRRRGAGWLCAPAVMTALVPPAALGIGFVVVFNRPGPLGMLYRDTLWIWSLALAARYAVIVVCIVLMAVGRRRMVLVDQARADGADAIDVVGRVLLPIIGPSLLAGGLIVVVLSLFEVVITQVVGPVGYPGIGMAILAQMHYRRDDVVITTSILVMAAGLLATQVVGRLLARGGGIRG